MNTTPRFNALLFCTLFLTWLAPTHAVERRVSPSGDSGGNNAAVIQNAINQSATGDVVVLNAGNYVLSSAITFKSGVSVKGDGAVALDATGLDTPLILDQTGALTTFTLDSITLKNIQLKFTGTASYGTMTNITLSNCTFTDIKNTGLSQTAYVAFAYGRNNKVENCKFFRPDQSYFGRAVQLFKTKNTSILNNTVRGFFLNAVVSSSASFDTEIIGNTFVRTPSELESKTDQNQNEDHGIYLASFNGLTVQRNTIGGWTATADGMCAKLRNGENAVFSENKCSKSGIGLFVYANAEPRYLKNIKIENNDFTLDPWNNTLSVYNGIGYYRTDAQGIEASIRIANNRLPQGCIFIAGYGNTVNTIATGATFNDNNGGIFNNRVAAANALSAPPSVTVSGTTYFYKSAALDVDGNGTPDAATDGLIILRYLMGFRGSAMTANALGLSPTRSTQEIQTYLDNKTASAEPAFSIASNGATTRPLATTDGILMIRHLLGMSGPALVNGIPVSVTLSTPEALTEYLTMLSP